jgi:hypothetical protein
MEGITNNNTTNNSPSSLILTARYGHESSKLIHLIEKNLYIVIGLIVFTSVLSIVNALGFHYLFEYSEDIDFLVDISLAVILIAVVMPLIILLLKSRRTLDRWDDMFVSNTLSISIGIAMAYRAKEEAVRAIMESVEQINQPLNNYVAANKSNFKEFIDISVDKNTIFDILIDSDHVLNGTNKDISNNLKNVLKAYGTIVVRILDGKIDRISVESYVSSLLRYVSKTKNQVGLAIIIGEQISSDTQKYSGQLQHKHKKSGKISNIILVEKPSSTILSSVG